MARNFTMRTNRTILEKADLAIADLVNDGGYLVPAQSASFIRSLVKESVIMKQATVVPMKAPKQLIETIRFASRILRPGTSAQALPLNERAKPNLTKVELDAQLFKAEVSLDNEVLEDSIERGDLTNTILAILGEAVSRDMEEVIVNGDSASADPFLAQLDGLLKLATSNVVDGGAVQARKTVLKNMLKTMPSEWLRIKKTMRYFTSVDAEIDYRDSMAERATPIGDAVLQEDIPVKYSGVPIVPVPLFPEDLGDSNNETNIILTDPKNIHVGIWRKIRIETDKDISAGTIQIVATLRFDVKYAQEVAVVKAEHVKVAA